MSKIYPPFSEFILSFSRSGGAGGQNVNKVNSKTTLNWFIDESPSLNGPQKFRFKQRFSQFVISDGSVQVSSQSSRSQKMNIDECVRKIHEMIEEIRLPPKKRIPTKPTKGSVKRRLESKKKDSLKKLLRQKV